MKLTITVSKDKLHKYSGSEHDLIQAINKNLNHRLAGSLPKDLGRHYEGAKIEFGVRDSTIIDSPIANAPLVNQLVNDVIKSTLSNSYIGG